MKKVVLSMVAVFALTGGIKAGGDIAPVLPAPMDSWSGFYVGIQSGGIWGDADVDYKTLKHNFGFNTTKGLDLNGFIGGIYGGYNWLLENDWLVGIEGEWNYVSADDTGPITNTPGWATKLEQNWDASLRLRAGKVMGDSLLYVTGGVAWGSFDLDAYDSANPADGFHGNYTLTGWTLGAGLEYKLTENIHARIQYRYTDYGDDTKRIASNPPNFIDAKLDYDAHMVTVGISYRF